MTITAHPAPSTHTGRLATCLAALAAVLLPAAGMAQLTDIASVPLASSASTTVKPNILFTLDNSGSMAWSHMPDAINVWTGFVGYKNHLCNSIYYNPAFTYVPPKNADGTDFTNATFTAALTNGFNSGSATRDLSNSFIAYDNLSGANSVTDTAQAAYYYRFNGAGTPTSVQCQEVSSSVFPHSSANFVKVQVSATSGPGGTDERTNFANWFSYYRTRMLMMKSATGRAFAGIGAGYRVGFITINPGMPVQSSNYLAIADFDSTHKAAWFSKLYAQGTTGATPLREALSRAGRHFAGLRSGINSGMTGDPVQYSCQQNFTFLTTDGYWNGNAGVRLDGATAIGNHDGDISVTPRPLYDGSVTTVSSRRTEVLEFYSTAGCLVGRRVRSTTTVTTTPVSPPGTPVVTSSSTNLTACSTTPRALQNPNPAVTTATINSTSGGASGSLADVAAYYYLTDLRAAGSIGALGTDVGTDNNVPSGGTGPEDDSARHQHMTTFTMGLGLSGTLDFRPNYKTGAGDFAALRSGALNWPAPTADSSTALDDLWHAAVNGRGQFFSASDPDAVVEGLAAALAGVSARLASAAAAATSNLEPVAGDNFAYTASYKTVEWIGDIEAKSINLVSGAVSTTPVWSARAKLDLRTGAACDNRTIWLFRSGAAGNLANFTWNTQACDSAGNPAGAASTGLNAAEQAFFGATQVAALNHFANMSDGSGSTVDQRSLAAGANMLNFIRGQRGREGFETNTQLLYRARTGVLGDIVNAQPVFVRPPFASYGDTGYEAFKAANASRTPMLYVAANDGMLHAFYAGSSTTDPLGGEERWAFIPTMVMPDLFRLADRDYGTLRRYYVDGTPLVGDIYDAAAGQWKTILVGGLNAGGRGYYALDITDPGTPKGLWEFKHTPTCAAIPAGQTSDCHLGLTFGNPQISKLADGRCVVLVTSRYNNVNSPAQTGDGIGYLYVLDAASGTIIYKISTGTGSAAQPSGLGKINAFVFNTAVNNTTERVYGVDLQGNVWRFEVNATQSATRVITLVDSLGNPQPITTKPELAEFGSPPTTHIFVATGRYLGTTDVASTQTQTVWGIKDGGSYPIANPRTTFSNLTATNSAENLTRSITCSSNCVTNGGWFTDLPDTGERVNVDMKLQLGTLTVASNVPQNNACNIGGYSWLNFLDARNGLQVAGSPSFGTKLSDSLAVGINVVRLPDSRTVVIATTSDAIQQTAEVPVAASDPQGRRISWRELVQ